MNKYPQIDSLFQLVEEISDLREAKDLLQEVWLTTNASDAVNYELSIKVDKYFSKKIRTDETL